MRNQISDRRFTTILSRGIGVLVLVAVAGPAFATESQNTWESDIQVFEQEDKASPPPKDAILFVGSSTIRFWDVKAAFPQYATIRRGFGGSEIADATYYADRIVTPYKPRAIVMYSGDNDIAKGKTAQQVFEDFKAFVAKVRAEPPDTPIVMCSIKPSVARKQFIPAQREANALIQAYCKEGKALYYLDMVPDMLDEHGEPRAGYLRSDGLHLNDAGYRVWNEKLTKELERVLPTPPGAAGTK